MVKSKINKRIYLDYAATTPVDKEVLKAMAPYFSVKFGNPSSIHYFGQEAMAAVDQARAKIAGFLNCNFDEIIFTSSATEANNLAIKGIELGIKNYELGKKYHFITTNIEHESVYEPLRELEKLGHKITYLKANKAGFISISDLEKSIKNDTLFVSVIYANNEIGTIQPVKEIGKLLKKINEKRHASGLSKIYFHTDAVQALNYLECRPDWLKADMLTFSGHKIYGPKGVGGLYIREGTPVLPVITGGGQEFSLRSGTENVPNIIGLTKALELTFKNRNARFNKVLNLRDKLWDNIIRNNKSAKLNGSLDNGLPNNLNIRFPGINNELLLIALDQAGVAVSAGSACSSRSMLPSRVLTAIGLTAHQAKESIRITIGRDTTEKEIKQAAEIIAKTVRILNTKY